MAKKRSKKKADQSLPKIKMVKGKPIVQEFVAMPPFMLARLSKQIKGVTDVPADQGNEADQEGEVPHGPINDVF